MASKTLRELTIKIDADVAELKKDLAKANKQMSGFQKRIKKTGSAFKEAFSIAAIGIAVVKVADVVSEMSSLGKELEGVKAGFKGIDPQVLIDMKKATHGTVTELELMKAAVQAKNFGLPVKELGTMLEFVHRRARASGESVDYLTKSLVTGLGRKSAMIIDNLGISTSQLNDQLKLTPDFTTAVAEIMKRDMASSGKYIETAADITERWGAEWENSKAKIGLFINKGIKLIAPIIDDLKNDFAELFDTKAIIEFINSWITLYNESIIFRAVIAGLKTNFKIMWITFKGSVNLMVDAIKVLGKTIMFSLTPSNWGKGFGDGIAKILKDGAIEAKADALKMGKEIGEATYDGINETMAGKKDLITSKIFTPDIIPKAKKLGEDIAQGVGDGIRSKMDNIPTIESLAFGGFAQGAPTIDTSQISTAGATISEVTEKIKVDMSSVNNFLASSFVQLGENIGNSFSGMGGMLDGFLNILIDFAAQFGKILISLGIAKLALDNLGFGNPYVAIAAGVALVALSIIAKNLVNNGPGFAGGGIIPGSSIAHDRIPIMANSGEMVLNSGQQSSLFRMLNSGGGNSGGGVLTTKVSGQDLLFVLNEAKRVNLNSF